MAKEGGNSLLQLRMFSLLKGRNSILLIALGTGALTCCLILLSLFLIYSPSFNFRSFLHWSVVFFFGLVFIGIAITFIRVQRAEKRDSNQLREQVLTKVYYLQNLLQALADLVVKFDKIPLEQWHLVSPKGTKLLSSAKTVLHLAEERLKEVKKLSSNEESENVAEAFELLLEKLEFESGSCDMVVSEDSIPALELDDWEPTIRTLCKGLEAEFHSSNSPSSDPSASKME